MCTAAYVIEDGIRLLYLHNIQDVIWDVAGLATAIP